MMRRGLWIAVGVVVVLVLAALLVFGSYVSARNQMVAKQEGVQELWSNVQAQLQRRADLIPNLVATVKGYAQHEEAVFDDVDKARESLLAAHDPQSAIKANGSLDSALGRLLAVAENYPNLKANENFLQLQDSLEGTENRITVTRERYNAGLRDYNTFIRQFPNNIWAGIAGFQVNNAYFEASPASQNVPQVKF
ncbi:MAG TPA: LemA family protein [Acidobacteriaceae bacterium]|jgi:LemA protein|nr:LemA family protein [Acidobacteriaceae bacterium]